MIDDIDHDIAMVQRAVEAEQRAGEQLHTELEMQVRAAQAARDRRYLKISLGITAGLMVGIALLGMLAHV